MAFTYAVLRDRRSLDVLDHELLGAYRKAYLTTLVWNLNRLLKLDEILGETRIRGLRLVVVKGGLLSRTHYGDPGARPMSDVDAICDPAELRGHIEVAHKFGFRPYPHASWRMDRSATHDVQLSNGSVVIELHHRLWHELRIDSSVQGLVSRATEIRFGAGWVHAPDLADHLYVVLVHAALHGFTGNPLWLIDAALLATSAGDQVWERVHELARSAGAEVPMTAARDHLALVFPEIVPRQPGCVSGRRYVLRKLAPWLQRGERELGLWPSRMVRPLLFDRAGPFMDWAGEKAYIWLRSRVERSGFRQ